MRNLKRILLVLTIALTTLTGCKKEPIDDNKVYKVQLRYEGSMGYSDDYKPNTYWNYNRVPLFI